MNKLFPTIIIALALCASIGYIPNGDWRKVVYWFGVALVTAMVTW